MAADNNYRCLPVAPEMEEFAEIENINTLSRWNTYAIKNYDNEKTCQIDAAETQLNNLTCLQVNFCANVFTFV